MISTSFEESLFSQIINEIKSKLKCTYKEDNNSDWNWALFRGSYTNNRWTLFRGSYTNDKNGYPKQRIVVISLIDDEIEIDFRLIDEHLYNNQSVSIYCCRWPMYHPDVINELIRCIDKFIIKGLIHYPKIEA